MPKGNSPREKQLARLSLLESELKKKTDKSLPKKAMTLLRKLVNGATTQVDSAEVKSLKREIAKRETSLLKNANKLGGKGI